MIFDVKTASLGRMPFLDIWEIETFTKTLKFKKAALDFLQTSSFRTYLHNLTGKSMFRRKSTKKQPETPFISPPHYSYTHVAASHCH